MIAKTVRLDSGCRVFVDGYCNPKGYGMVMVGPTPRLVHRIAWEHEVGPLRSGVKVLHHCDTPACTEVAHLFLGSIADNNADMIAKGRGRMGAANKAKTHCPAGHAYDDANTYTDRRGRRSCRACALVRWHHRGSQPRCLP